MGLENEGEIESFQADFARDTEVELRQLCDVEVGLIVERTMFKKVSDWESHLYCVCKIDETADLI